MRYADEVAQSSTARLAKRKRYLEDIDALIDDYERLKVRDTRNGRRVEVLEKDLRAMRRARDAAKTELAAAQKSRNELKSSLKALRSSKSFRLGRALGAPARLLARLYAVAVRLVRGRLIRGTARPVVPSPVPLRMHDRPAPARALTREQLLSAFAETGSISAAVNVVSHDYFDRGAISEPADFIRDHAELLRDASGKELALIENILGQDELLKQDPLLAPRQPNAGYFAERARIMYCAHSTGHYNSNGYSTRTAGVVAGLKDNHEDVIVVARPGYPWDAKADVAVTSAGRFEREISGVTHIFNPGPSWTGDRLDFYLTEAVDVYVREAQRNRVSVIHAASNYVTALPALIAARRLGIPFVYEVRGLWEITQLSNNPSWGETDRFKLATRLERLVSSEADAVLAITSQVRDELIRRGVEADSISLLPNSVNTDTFTPMPVLEPLRQKLGLTADTTVVGYTGSLVPYEGIEDLLAAAKLVLDQGLDIAVVIVGDGTHLAELKRLAADLGIGANVIFTGRVAATEVPDYVSLFDIMPCPRRRLPVTEMVSPLKPLEAMASGKAIILSDLAPSRDLAGTGQERALLCAAGEPASLAAAITTLANDAELRLAMGRRARLWTIAERTWKMAGVKALEAHSRASSRYAAVSGRGLQELTIGIISDEFTLEGLRGEAKLVELLPDSWREQVSAQPLDALFVESAWEGLGGKWNQKVGYYDEERFATLKAIVEHCRAAGIPTIFWNKEDPVHFNRFRRTSKSFDHVFTTDSDCIRRYKASAGAWQQTVASLPFYAQPRLHNIVPSTRPYDHSVAYAGSFYGDRYKSRSEELANLLSVARNHGLTIYDRQHLNPDSPYRFPAHLARYVRGGLEYVEMVNAYKAHPVHINVNSVDESPTMFSRRVMEVAASGSAVISGRGVGVEHVLNGLVPIVNGTDEAELLVSEWMGNERARIRDAWLAYRHVHRGHTAAHRLAYVLRTAGIVVRAPELPAYAVFVPELTADVVAMLNIQTERPVRVYCARAAADTDLPVEIVSSFDDAARAAASQGIPFLGHPGVSHADRTVFEDMLTTSRFGDWGAVSISSDDLEIPGLGLAQLGGGARPGAGHGPRLAALGPAGRGDELRLRRELVPAAVIPARGEEPRQMNVLVAGHDLKFASGIIGELEALGHRLSIDQWIDHTKHDEARSHELLATADVIFCEWTLGNAVWYSKNKAAHQRLVTRLHLQEIFRPYVRDVSYPEVDQVVFVGQHILDLAVRDHGVPASKSLVVPNSVDSQSLHRRKLDGARFNLGLVGIVPARKRLDKALDILRSLREHDERYRLFIKGKRPEDFAWMANRPEEMAYYEDQYARIEADPLLAGAVIFDAQGDDMSEWYRKIGIVLSVSDFESFHLTLPDGAASGAVPVSLAWTGADQIYPPSWLFAEDRSMADFISGLDEESWTRAADAASDLVVAKFDQRTVLPNLARVILGQ